MGETGSSAADISFHTAICAGYAKVEGALLVVDARPLVGKANGVAPIEDGDDGLREVRVDEVFHNLANHHERDMTALFLHALIDGVGRLFQIGTDVLRLDNDHARRRQHVVVDGDARRIHGARCFFCCVVARDPLFAHTGNVLVIGRRVSRVDHGVEVV